MTITDYITEIIDGRINIEDVPPEIRDRVANGVRIRRDRHEGHSTNRNDDGTITVINDTLRVTLPESEFNGRQDVFTRAMRMLGHTSELQIPDPPIMDQQVRDIAMQNLTYQFLAEHCHYDLSQVIARLNGGHRLSAGMQADVDAARARARAELNDNPKPHIDEAWRDLEREQSSERKYHEHIAGDCNGWKIEIIGVMPDQIGLCRYRSH